jgi:hypothetical protein
LYVALFFSFLLTILFSYILKSDQVERNLESFETISGKDENKVLFEILSVFQALNI